MSTMIDIAAHPHNLDKTARLVWGEMKPLTGVYSVRAGYIATIDMQAFPETFATLDAARAAIYAATGRDVAA